MQDTDVRDVLRAYVADGEPPMGLRSTDVLMAGRRSRRNRMMAGFAGAGLAAALAVTVAVVFVPAVFSADRNQRNAAGDGFGPAELCAVPPGPRPPGGVAEDKTLSKQMVAWATTSLTCHLGEVMPRLLPDARYGQVPGAPAGPLVGYTHGRTPPWGTRVDAIALVRDAKGVGDLVVQVQVSSPKSAADAATDCRNPEAWVPCTVRTGPNGETVLVNEGTVPLDRGYSNVVVRAYRGHTHVLVEASNTDRQAVNGPPRGKRPQPVLSVDQAVELATSAELYLFP